MEKEVKKNFEHLLDLIDGTYNTCKENSFDEAVKQLKSITQTIEAIWTDNLTGYECDFQSDMTNEMCDFVKETKISLQNSWWGNSVDYTATIVINAICNLRNLYIDINSYFLKQLSYDERKQMLEAIRN